MCRFALAVCLVAGVLANAAGARDAPAPTPFLDGASPTGLDLADLVPRRGRLDRVWYAPARRKPARVVVAWQFRDPTPVIGWPDTRRYALTLWTAEHITATGARWIPHTLIRASPFPFSPESVRLADVTGDGDDDLLVTVLCSDCNHAAAVASIYAVVDGSARRIYGGRGHLGVAKGSRPDAIVRGREIIETAWGARDGLVWFDEPRGGTAVCCPAFRLQTFMRWVGDGRGWRVVSTRRVGPYDDPLVLRGFPAL